MIPLAIRLVTITVTTTMRHHRVVRGLSAWEGA